MINKIKYSFLKNGLRKPIYLIFFVTSRCNSKCKHCFFYKELNKPREMDLTLEEIEKVSKELGKLVWVDLSGGEPFMRDDLFEIFKIFVDNNQVESFSIPTNGILTEKIYSDVKKMLEYGKVKNFNLTLSLEGTKDIHNEIRGVKCYDQVFKTYERIKELKKKFSHLSIYVSTTLSNKNIDNLHDLHAELLNRMPELDYHNFEILRGDPKEKEYAPPSLRKLRKIKPFLFKIWKKYDYYNNKIQSKIAMNTKKNLYNIYLDILENNKQPFLCYAGKVHAVLDYQGNVYFCELPGVQGGKLGNIRERSFMEIWNSKKAKAVRNFIKERKCTCTHSCFQITNYIFNQKNWFKLLK